MHFARRLLIALLLLSPAACARGPSRDEVVQAVRAAQPALERTDVVGRVWQDGPPWFSCAEVIAKFTTPIDSAAVRDQVGNWKPLVVAGLIVLHDSASGPVADPGWCVARPTPAGQAVTAAWTPATGGPFPTGTARHGWMMIVGRHRIRVAESPKRISEDAATATYLVTLEPNANGVATRADRDTARFVADLRKVDGAWQVTGTRPAPRPAR